MKSCLVMPLFLAGVFWRNHWHTSNRTLKEQKEELLMSLWAEVSDKGQWCSLKLPRAGGMVNISIQNLTGKQKKLESWLPEHGKSCGLRKEQSSCQIIASEGKCSSLSLLTPGTPSVLSIHCHYYHQENMIDTVQRS
jgi:hypothetical protein